MSIKFEAQLVLAFWYIAYIRILTRCPTVRCFHVAMVSTRQPRLINLHRNGQDIISHSFQATKRPAYRIASSSATSYELSCKLVIRPISHFLNSTVIAPIDVYGIRKKKISRRRNKFSSLSPSISMSKKFKLEVYKIYSIQIHSYADQRRFRFDYFWDIFRNGILDFLLCLMHGEKGNGKFNSWRYFDNSCSNNCQYL